MSRRRSAISGPRSIRSSRRRSSVSPRSAAPSRPKCCRPWRSSTSSRSCLRCPIPTSKAECSAEEAYRHTQGPRAVRLRQPLRSRQARRQDLRAAPGQQLLYLPRRRPRRDRKREPPCHRRDVHGGGAYAGAIRSARTISRRAASIRRCRESARSRRRSARPSPTSPISAGSQRDRRRTTRIGFIQSQMYDPHY